MGLKIFLRIGNECAAKTDLWKGLGIFLRSENELAAKTEFGIVLQFFCRIEVGLRIICPGGERRGIGIRKILSKKKKGERELGLE